MILLLSACGGDTETESASATAGNASSATTSSERERFILRDTDGQLRKWSEFTGQPIVVNFWATWCGPCLQEIPVLKKLYAEYKPQGVEIIGISLDQPDKTIQNVIPFARKMEIPWVIVYGDMSSAQEFGLGQSIPMTVFYNAEGEETGRLTGAHPEETFRAEFEKMTR